MGRGRGTGQEQEHFFGKVFASGGDFNGIEEDVSRHGTFSTLFR